MRQEQGERSVLLAPLHRLPTRLPQFHSLDQFLEHFGRTLLLDPLDGVSHKGVLTVILCPNDYPHQFLHGGPVLNTRDPTPLDEAHEVRRPFHGRKRKGIVI